MARVADRSVGAEVRRKEDPELITGEARYTDDISVPAMLWMHVVRSPFAHARITSVDVSKALAMEGVVGAFSGQDLADDWAGPMLMAWPVTEDIHNPPHWPLTKDKARYQGDGVAVVVAETRAIAADAAELVEVDYEPLDAVVDMETALRDGSTLVHDDVGTNKSYTWTLTNGDVDTVFSRAPVVVKQRYRIQRQIPNAIEARGVLAQPTPSTGEFILWTSSQIPHIVKVGMAITTGIPESKLRIIAPRVGGGFGSKLQVYPEEALALALAKRLRRPIKWTETRSENYLATHHGRDQIQEIELAADGNGKILGYRDRILVNMGAYLMIITPGTPLLGAFVFCGPYGGEAYHIEFTGVFTTTVPTDAYRGAGRPEAAYAMERSIDALARQVGRDPVEIRRMNFIPAFTEPTPSPGGLTLDSGNYESTLDRALELVGYEQLRKEQQARRDSGDIKQLGIGFSTYLEMCGLAPSRVLSSLRYAAGGWDAASIRVLPTGKVTMAIATKPPSPRSLPTISASRSRTSRLSSATPSWRLGAWTPTGAEASRWGAWPCIGPPRRSWRRHGRSPRTSWRSQRRTWTTRTASSWSRALRTRRRRSRSWPSRRGRPTTSQTASSQDSTRWPSTTRRTSCSRTVRISARWKWTPRPAASTCSGTSPWMTSARSSILKSWTARW